MPLTAAFFSHLTMKLHLDRQISLCEDHNGFAEVITEARKWTKGWVARVEVGKRIFLNHRDALLSCAGFGERHFQIAKEGYYEAESACVSLRAHRVRFDVLSGGVIRLRQSNYTFRCTHLRELDPPHHDISPSGPLSLLRSIVSPDEPREAAILLGGHLEQHLQFMCEDRGMQTHVDGRTKGIDALSAALKARGVYPTEVHKVIIRLAAIRKRAQHQGESPNEDEITEAVLRFFEFRRAFPATKPIG